MARTTVVVESTKTSHVLVPRCLLFCLMVNLLARDVLVKVQRCAVVASGIGAITGSFSVAPLETPPLLSPSSPASIAQTSPEVVLVLGGDGGDD